MVIKIQQTSLQAYVELRDSHLGKRQAQIYNAFKKFYKATDRDILNYLNYTDMNQVRPRRRELEKKGWIKKVGTKIDKYTQKQVNVYSIYI